MNAAGSGLVYCGYIGGWVNEEGLRGRGGRRGQRLRHGRHRLLRRFPGQDRPGPTFGGRFDGFVAKVNADGTGLDYSGYIGGVETDVRYGIAVDGSGNAYVTGYTEQRRNELSA